jgi:hypothetical protein
LGIRKDFSMRPSWWQVPMTKPWVGSVRFEDDFDSPTLEESLWLPAYLPHWSSREASRPRYRIESGNLVLMIEPDQQPWCPEFNGSIRLSNLQTGTFSGSLGSSIGQHRFSHECRVREEQRTIAPKPRARTSAAQSALAGATRAEA